MILYIINGLFIAIISIFEYNRYKLIQSLKKIDNGVYARYEWDGWYSVSGDPNKTWSVFFTLKEVAKSKDGSKTKFKVIKVLSSNDKDTDTSFERYEKKFYNQSEDGWLDTNNKDLFYFGETKSVWEERNKKLEALGIK
jgi:hypothetical protein